jgi:ABC-2 type transport system permease protein
MRQAFTLALLHVKLTFKSKASLISMFALPLLLTLIFGLMLQGTGTGQTSNAAVFPVAVVDRDSSFASRALVEALGQERSVSLQAVTQEQMDKRFADQQIVVGIVIPRGFAEGLKAGTSPEVTLVTTPGGNVYTGVAPTIRRAIAQVSQDYRLALQAAGAAADAAQIEATYGQVAADRKAVGSTTVVQPVAKTESGIVQKDSPLGIAAVGFTVTFVMMLVFMMGGVILQERQRGTWGRLLVTPASRLSLLGGYVLSFFLTGMAQFAILVAATRLLFGVSWGPVLPLTAMAAATVLCGGAMGLFLAGLVRTYEQQMTAGILFINATSMLGGVYWDLSFVSKTMQRIGYLTPQAWAIDGFREVMLRGAQWANLVLPLAVLLGIALVFMTAGLLRVRYE